MKLWIWMAVLLGVQLGAALASAMPVDRTLDLKGKDLHFERVRFVHAANVEPRDLATVEIFPTGEMLVTPLRDGHGLLFLYEEGQVEVVRLNIGEHVDPLPLNLASLQAHCRDVETRTIDGEVFLHASVEDQACRVALKAALADDAVQAGHLRLRYSVAALQAQLQDMQAKLREAGVQGIEISYEGATLRLRGQTDAATQQRALSALWPEALGRFGLDNQLQISPPDSAAKP